MTQYIVKDTVSDEYYRRVNSFTRDFLAARRFATISRATEVANLMRSSYHRRVTIVDQDGIPVPTDDQDQQDMSLSDQIRREVNRQLNEESLNSIARNSSIDPGALSRFMRSERSLTLDAADKLFDYLGMKVAAGTRKKKK